MRLNAANPDESPDDNSEGGDELYEHFSFTADKGQEPLRIDKFLVNRIEKASRTRIRRCVVAHTGKQLQGFAPIFEPVYDHNCATKC